MDWVVLFKKVAFGAGQAAVDAGGAVLLPGAWPILRAAYQPVMDGLKTRLGIVDSKPSPEQIEKLVAAFEADQTLQNAFRSSVLDQLGDIQKLKEIIAGDREKVTASLAGADQLRADLDRGAEARAGEA